MEKYLWFLLLHSEKDKLRQRAEVLQTVELQTPGSALILEAILKSNSTTLQDISAQLPEDLQQTVFQLYSQDMLLAGMDKLDMNKEWQQTMSQLEQEVSHLRNIQITQELEEIDRVRDKTPELLAKQEKLLRELVQLKR